MFKIKTAASAALIAVLSASPALAADADVNALRNEVEKMRQAYEQRINQLEAKLNQLEGNRAQVGTTANTPPATSRRRIADNSFNPSIGMILNGQFRQYSQSESEMPGFAVSHEGERGEEGLGLGHSEISLSANVDDKFLASSTLAIAEHEGETETELEEAYIQTLPGAGLPVGMSVKAGRAFWTLGYLNEHHSHADDFADRPLPYRVFMNHAYNDDGLQVSYLLPTDGYAEIGGGVYRGDDFPYGGNSGSGSGAWSAYARIGGDIGDNQSWRVGAYMLSGEAEGGRASNEETVTFTGDSDLEIIDLRYTWAPTGNARDREVIVQAEYFQREEDGVYAADSGVVEATVNGKSDDGWYLQGVYKFAPQWRVGARYSELSSDATPTDLIGTDLDSEGHDPEVLSLMVDWTNSEFSRVRLQLNREDLSGGETDEQAVLQYVMSIGAHGAHKY